MDNLAKYNKILKKKYGYESLKKEQYEIINSIVSDNKDVLGILATGFGKSICYQMPHLITKKSVIVVSPLIALMTDQMTELKKLNISATVLNSTCKNKEVVMDEILEGDNKIIYITPEYMENCEGFIKMLIENDQLCLIAIDEAHCVSTWGLDFRKSYTELKNIRDWTSSADVPLLAVTATASKKVRRDIIKILQLEEPHTIVGDFDRHNLYISVKTKTNKSNVSRGTEPAAEDLEDLITKNKNNYIIIYCKTREETEKLSEIINSWDILSMAYHAGLNNKIRDEIQKKFINGEIKCIVATIAFGMGINIKNVRLVIHYNCPKNLESYYQEIGRAGRDGLPSECHLYYSKKDFVINRLFLENISDKKHKDYQEEQIQLIEKYVNSMGCRRLLLLKSFDDKYTKDRCDNCDNCLKNKNNKNNLEPILETKKDYSIASYIILKVINKLNGSYGINMYINIIRGSNAKNITDFMKKLKYYNIGKKYSVDWFKEIIIRLLNEKYLVEKKLKTCAGCIVGCTEKSKKWLKYIKESYLKKEKDDNISNGSNKSNKKINFDSNIKFAEKDKLYLTEIKSKLKTNNNIDDIFTDDILKRFDLDL